MKHLFLWLLVPALLTVSFLNCSRVQLEQVEKVEYASLDPDATFCVNPPLEVGKYSNILFIIDVSGSNAQGTDVGKVRRLGAMQSFFAKHGGNSYLRWGLEIFGGDVPGSARQLIMTSNNTHFGDASQFQAALEEFKGVPDNNGTPYVGALNSARDALEKSILFARENSEETGSYQIIFISDGVPAPADASTDPTIFDIVKRMVELSEGQLHLSTVYYNVGGQATEGATERLQEMARLGNGRFQDASNGENINIDDLIMGGAYKEPYFIKDLFAYNLSSAVCDDGNIKADSDGDGLCDEDEERYNKVFKKEIDANPTYKGKLFSATNRFSFDARFSDLFMYKHIIEGEVLPACDHVEQNIISDTDQDLLNVCEEKFLYTKAPQGPTDAWTKSMIKLGNFASENNFDSDGDGLLDSLEFFFFKKKGYSMNYNTINSRMNGRTLYDYFKNHQSFVKPESSLPYNVKVTWIRKNDEGQNCYRIDQENLPVYKVKPVVSSGTGGNLKLVHNENENVILVYYLMTTENDPDGKGIMRYSYQRRMYNTRDPISYNDTRFDEVKAK